MAPLTGRVGIREKSWEGFNNLREVGGLDDVKYFFLKTPPVSEILVKT